MNRLQAAQTKFGARTRETLEYMSPLSLCVVFEQIKRGSTMSILDAFKMEYGMS